MKLRWTRRARRDLLEIGRYLARDKPIAARRWVERLRQRARAAAEMPGNGREVPEIGREDVREIFVRSYRIVYRICPDEVHVLTVFEGHRLLPRAVVRELLEDVQVEPERPPAAKVLSRVRKLGAGTADKPTAMIRADRRFASMAVPLPRDGTPYV